MGFLGYVAAKVMKEDARYLQRMGLGMPRMREKKPTFWFHAASVGEIRSLKMILLFLKENYPDFGVVISAMTASGCDMAKKEFSPDITLLLPIENRIALKHAIKSYNTKVFFITDTEIWPNLITAASETVPLILLNGRISYKTFKTYRRFRFIFAPLLRRFKYIIAKSGDDANKFRKLAGDRASVITGSNIKYRIDDISAVKSVPDFLSGKIALAASTHPPEEEIFLRAASKCGFDRIVVAPRHIRRGEKIKKTAKKLGLITGLYSKGETGEKILIADLYGILEPLYQKAHKIFVGGSLADKGGHNIFEALQYKKPVAVGTHTENFSDIIRLAEKHGLATLIHSEKELDEWLHAPEDDKLVNFEQFFKELEETRKDFLKTLGRCITECIG
jgi:3-deoxy-D-manno-octulosonic-acid transferase